MVITEEESFADMKLFENVQNTLFAVHSKKNACSLKTKPLNMCSEFWYVQHFYSMNIKVLSLAVQYARGSSGFQALFSHYHGTHIFLPSISMVQGHKVKDTSHCKTLGMC